MPGSNSRTHGREPLHNRFTSRTTAAGSRSVASLWWSLSSSSYWLLRCARFFSGFCFRTFLAGAVAGVAVADMAAGDSVALAAVVGAADLEVLAAEARAAVEQAAAGSGNRAASEPVICERLIRD